MIRLALVRVVVVIGALAGLFVSVPAAHTGGVVQTDGAEKTGKAAPTRRAVVKGKQGRTADEFMRRCEAFGFSGVVLVQKGSKPILRKGYGEARPGVPNTPETLYDLASASKQVTATAILYLESKGKLKLDDSIAKHLPDVLKEHRDITIHHLLTHTSGFPRFGASTGSYEDRSAAVAAYLSAKRTAKAGQRFEYWNGGYALLAAIVEEVTGAVFEDWLADGLFAKAKLLQTDFIETLRVDESLIAMDPLGEKLASDYIKGWSYRGMGGVLTSVCDVALWMRALNSGRLIPKRSLKDMFEPNKGGYACGWYSYQDQGGRLLHEHGGDTAIFGSHISHYPNSDLLIVLFTNDRRLKQRVLEGLTQVVVAETPVKENPPSVVVLKDSAREDLLGRWEGDAGTFDIEPKGSSFEFRSGSWDLIQLLEPIKPGGKARPARSGRDAFPEQTGMALRIVEQLLGGKTDLMLSVLQNKDWKGWAAEVVESILPSHVEEHGEVLSCSVLGAERATGSTYVVVWIVLHHEGKSTGVEIQFNSGKLAILDFLPNGKQAKARLAPTAKNKLEAVGLGTGVNFKLTLGKSGKTLTMLTPRHRHEFRRP